MARFRHGQLLAMQLLMAIRMQEHAVRCVVWAAPCPPDEMMDMPSRRVRQGLRTDRTEPALRILQV
jgi:hypothetical protein